MASEVTGAPNLGCDILSPTATRKVHQLSRTDPLYVVFVDFSKAFDTVGRTEL